METKLLLSLAVTPIEHSNFFLLTISMKVIVGVLSVLVDSG